MRFDEGQIQKERALSIRLNEFLGFGDHQFGSIGFTNLVLGQDLAGLDLLMAGNRLFIDENPIVVSPEVGRIIAVFNSCGLMSPQAIAPKY